LVATILAVTDFGGQVDRKLTGDEVGTRNDKAAEAKAAAEALRNGVDRAKQLVEEAKRTLGAQEPRRGAGFPAQTDGAIHLGDTGNGAADGSINPTALA